MRPTTATAPPCPSTCTPPGSGRPSMSKASAALPVRAPSGGPGQPGLGACDPQPLLSQLPGAARSQGSTQAACLPCSKVGRCATFQPADALTAFLSACPPPVWPHLPCSLRAEKAGRLLRHNAAAGCVAGEPCASRADHAGGAGLWQRRRRRSQRRRCSACGAAAAPAGQAPAAAGPGAAGAPPGATACGLAATPGGGAP